MVLVKFTRGQAFGATFYNGGETAGFTQEEADALVKSGAAVVVVNTEAAQELETKAQAKLAHASEETLAEAHAQAELEELRRVEAALEAKDAELTGPVLTAGAEAPAVDAPPNGPEVVNPPAPEPDPVKEAAAVASTNVSRPSSPKKGKR